MGWACSRCTLYNSSASAVCGACEQPRPPAQQQAAGAQPPEVIDLLDDSSDEGEALQRQQQQQQQQQQRQQQGKQQQTQEKQQQQDQRQRHGHIQQGHPLPQKQPAGPQQRGGRGAAGMIAAGSENAGMDAGKDSPSSDDSFQIELSDVTSSKRRRTLGAAGSASVKKQQPVGSATAAGNGSGSSAETAVLAGAGGGGSKSAAPRLPPRQPQPLKGTAAVAALVRPSPGGRDEPAGSVTSGSPAPLPDSTSGGQRQRREGQHERAGKRDHDHRAQREADTPSPAGLAGLSLPPSKKQRLAAGSNGATAGVSAPRSGQLQADAGVRGQGSSPAAPQAAPPSGLGALPLRHARLSKRSPQTLRGPRSTAAAQAQTGAGRPHGTSDLGQEPSLTVGGAALAAAGAAGPSPGRPPSRQLPPAARGLPVPLKPRMPGKPLEKHPQGQEVQQQQQQQQQLPQPVQASLRLPPRPPTAQGSSLGSPAAGPSLALGVRHARQEGYGEQQELEQSPGSVGLLRQQSSSASPAGKAPVEQQAEPDVRQDLATRMDGGDGERHDEQQGPPAVGPHTFWQGLEAAYGVPCCPPAGVPAGVPAGKVGGAAVAGSTPAWVRRARHCAVDATPALLAAAADCPPLELEGQGQHPKAGLASATQGWLAFRLAARLPEAAACCNAEEVLELGAAMAAAAGPPPPLGAALEPRRQLGQGSAAGVGMCHVASRLLAAASRYQAHPMKLEERTNRWFHTRTPTFRKTLHKRLGDAFASTGGAGSAGGRHGGRRVGGGAAHGPSRLGKGAGAAAGQARGSIQRYPPAGRSAMTGVKNSGYGSFWATSTIRGKQIWLGTYRTQAAAGRAVDLVWLWKWVRGGCQGALPAFNVPDKAYQQDKALLERLRSINDPKALVDFIKSVCGARK